MCGPQSVMQYTALVKIVTYVPSKVRSCAVTPDTLRRDISFSRNCNIPKLTSYIYRIALLLLEMLH